MSKGGKRIVDVGAENLDGDVVGSCVEVGAQTGSYLVEAAVEDKRIDEVVTPTVRDVVVPVAVAAEVVGVVAQLEVRLGEELPADPAGDGGDGGENDFVFGARTAPGPSSVRASGVLGNDAVRVRSGGAAAARCKARGPSAARMRRSVGTPAASRASR